MTSISLPIDILEKLSKNGMFTKNFIILSGIVNEVRGNLIKTTGLYSKFKGFSMSKSIVFYDLQSLVSKSIVMTSASNTPVYRLATKDNRFILLKDSDVDKLCNLSSSHAFVVYVALKYLCEIRKSDTITVVTSEVASFLDLSSSEVSIALKCLVRYANNKVSLAGKDGRSKVYLIK